MNSNITTLRAFAIIIVVLGHSIILYDTSWTWYVPGQECPFFAELKKIINVVQMPLFFSLSGYLFYYTIQKYSFTQILRKKAKRLLIPYFIIGFFWMDPIKILLKVPHHDNIVNLIKEQIIGNMNGHLWFLYTLFALFLAFKLLYTFKIIGNKKISYDILIIVCLLLCNIFNGAFGPFANIASYAIFFYLAFFMNERASALNNINKLGGVIIMISVLIIIAYLLDIIPFKLYKCLIACAFILIIYRLDFKSIGDNSILNKISNCSFGIYLFHSPMIYITCTYWNDLNPIFVLLINFIIFGFMAFLLTMIIKSSRLKFIIGE